MQDRISRLSGLNRMGWKSVARWDSNENEGRLGEEEGLSADGGAGIIRPALRDCRFTQMIGGRVGGRDDWGRGLRRRGDHGRRVVRRSSLRENHARILVHER